MSTNDKNSMRLTPKKIVNHGAGIRFTVPLYQRLFAWSKREVSELLNDLSFHFEKWADADFSDLHYPYYMGVVTTIPYNNGRLCLVDGQQRCTVLMIMASVFGRISSDWRAFFDNGDRLELFARDDDTEYLKSLARGPVQGRYVNVLMAEAYKEIDDFLNKMDEKQQKTFVDNCFSRITILNSTLPDNYLQEPASLNKYFEVMNSAGINLEQHEVLKVSLLCEQGSQTRLLQIWNICADFSKPLLKKIENVVSEEYSQEYEKLFAMPTEQAVDKIMRYNRSSDADGYDDIPNLTIAEIDIETQEFDNPLAERNEKSVLTFPEFLLLALDIYQGLNGDWAYYKVDKLNERFKENLKPKEIPGFYDCMLKLRIALDLYVIRRQIDGQESDYNLILQSDCKKAEHDCLEQYEAMLSVSTPYYKWLKALFKYVLKDESDKTPAAILSHMKKWDNDEHPYPASVCELAYNNVDRYWFWRLDYYLWEQISCQKATHEDSAAYSQAIAAYTFRTNRSIEHLHPQDEANNTKWEREDIDSFGNLAMISQSFNSQQSNEDVHVKFSRIESQVRNKTLQSIKLLKMYLSAKGSPEGWTPETAKIHEEEMLRVLAESYSLN